MSRSDTRERIVEAARSLFWEQGFSATSLAQIAKRSGAMTGSIYYFFKTKDDILDAVISHYDEQLAAWLVDPVFARTSDPRERIFGIIDSYRSFLVETHFSLGCPVGGLASELGAEHASARKRLGEIFAKLTAVLEGCALQLAEDHDTVLDAPALAALSLTVIEGGIVQSRAAASIAPFDAAVRGLSDYFDVRLTAPH